VASNGDLSSRDLRVHLFATDNEAFMATAAAITEIIKLNTDKNQTSNVILAAGNSVSKTLSFLSPSATDWQRVNWYLADERHVGTENPLRNDRQIAVALRNSLGESHGRVFSPSPLLALKEAAAKYASRIEQINMFDVCLLGMGNDGHIASLTPKHPALNSSQLCCEMTDSPNLPKERITLTLKTFSRTQNRILVTTGPSKVAAVRKYITDSQSPVRLYNPTAIFADQAAYS
jgi:6-phosphogluconolactonase